MRIPRPTLAEDSEDAEVFRYFMNEYRPDDDGTPRGCSGRGGRSLSEQVLRSSSLSTGRPCAAGPTKAGQGGSAAGYTRIAFYRQP